MNERTAILLAHNIEFAGMRGFGESSLNLRIIKGCSRRARHDWMQELCLRVMRQYIIAIVFNALLLVPPLLT